LDRSEDEGELNDEVNDGDEMNAILYTLATTIELNKRFRTLSKRSCNKLQLQLALWLSTTSLASRSEINTDSSFVDSRIEKAALIAQDFSVQLGVGQ
jgi:hypothetical protein